MPLKKRMPQAPVVARQANQPQQLSRTLSVVQGTLQQRKLKVRNIDARVVSVQDLQKLFGKCGPLISALFDTNEFGQYMGTATVIYSRASSAQRAIKEYHLARIDQRPMKVDYALKPAQPQKATNVMKQNAKPAINNQAQKQQNAMPAKRRNNNRIGKSGQGKTLNVRGVNRQRRQRGRMNQ